MAEQHSHTERLRMETERMDSERQRFIGSIKRSATGAELQLAGICFEAGFLAGVRNARDDFSSDETVTKP